jgi:beta-glucosidase
MQQLRGRSMLLCTLVPCVCFAAPSAKSPGCSENGRVDRLLAQMTIEEKVNLIRGGAEPASENQGEAGFLPAVPRLGIPSLRFADGPPGVLTRVPAQAPTATMGVAATWSRSTAERNGVVIGRDARSVGIDVVLQPLINIDRDISFARGYNTFGEDPFLSGEMGASEIRGVQSQGVMAQAKHYVGYDTDNYDVVIDPQTLHEVYVAPFAAAVAAGVASIMCSYNRINAQYACGNSGTLQTILRKELGFEGFVTSGWGAIHNVRFINRGLDMEMPGDLGPDSPPSPYTYFQTHAPDPAKKPAIDPGALDPGALAGLWRDTLPEEPPNALHFGGFPRDRDHTTLARVLRDGVVTEVTVTAAARRVVCELDRFGYLDGKRKQALPAPAIEANAKVIERTAEEASVLLKNRDHVLPLKSDDLASLAVIGPTAGQVASIGLFGERSPGLTQRQVGPAEAIARLAPGSHLVLAVDDDMTGTPIPATALSHEGKPGLERGTANATEVDKTLNFTATSHSSLPPDSSASWSGDLSIATAGNYWLYLQVSGGRAVLNVDGKMVGRTGAVMGAMHGDIQHATQDNVLPTQDGLDNVRRAVQLEAGKHALSVQLSPDTSHAPAQIRLSWMTPEARDAAHLAAIQAARNARTAVVFVWTRGRPVFGLPGSQDELIEAVAAANPNTIVVLNTSQPVAMPWLDRVKGVLQMWWPGDEGGWATARILLGKANPSGHLPFTWARRLEDYPATDPAHPERSARGVDGKTTFSEGLLVGYRWFDSEHIEPLFPFGFGLSYSSFEILGAKGRRTSSGGAAVSVRVRNAGKAAGDVVPQLYLEAPSAPVQGIMFAPRTLAGFERLRLAGNETREVTLQIPARAFQYWSESAHRWQAPEGTRVIRVGLSSRELAATVTLP